WVDAAELYRVAFITSKRILGEAHPGTLSITDHLAQIYEAKSRWGEVSVLYRQCLDIRRDNNVYGHPETLSTMENIAAMCMHQGHRPEAFDLYRELFEKRTFVTTRPETWEGMGFLRNHAIRGERWNEAEKLRRAILDEKRRFLGADDPTTLDWQPPLALVYQKQHRWDEAETLLRDYIDRSLEVNGLSHKITLHGLQEMQAVWGPRESLRCPSLAAAACLGLFTSGRQDVFRLGGRCWKDTRKPPA
ncbi:hypothetical protein P152DRAFT_400974, partial [Eremomyces bilateralis CBS 781.70]